MPSAISDTLPKANSSDIHLTNPTHEERLATWNLNSSAWKGALNKEKYLERESYLMTVPLAKDGGITHWILVDKNLPPNQRPILASCESLRKRAFVSKEGIVTEVICHGIGSVFCNPEHRGRGYASRMMQDLGQLLKLWQSEKKSCAFSLLWSDIGMEFYKDLKWYPFPSSHVEFPPMQLAEKVTSATWLQSAHLKALCEEDEEFIRETLVKQQDGKTHVAVIPEFDQMQWHHHREEFLCQILFGKEPILKGAIAGERGQRMWAVWTRSLYGPVDGNSGNTLHILRLVVENEPSPSTFSSKSGGPMYDDYSLEQRAKQLKSILQMAQAQAAEWKLNGVELWNPTPLVKLLIEKTELIHQSVDRQKEGIPSLMWYGDGSGNTDEIEWTGNEKYAWC